MNLFSKKILTMSLTTALSVNAQFAHADSDAQAYIDWDNLNVEYFDLSAGNDAPILSWTNRIGESHADAYSFDPNEEQSQTKRAADFQSALLADASTAYAQSSSWRDSHDLAVDAASQVSTSSQNNWMWANNNTANASAQNSGDFILSGHGIALITLDWSISGASDAVDPWNDYASAGISIYGNYDNGTMSSFSNDANQDTMFGDFSQEGTFTMTIFGDGIHAVSGSLSALARANSYNFVTLNSEIASVPVPAAVWLFGSALLGLIGVSRRKDTGLS